MITQLTIFEKEGNYFTDLLSLHVHENSKESEKILNSNKDHFKNQCEKILLELQKGNRLTVRDMALRMNIGDPRARIRDLRRTMTIKDELLEGRFKTYFL